MSESWKSDVSGEDLIQVEVRNPEGVPSGYIGVPAEAVTNRPVYTDGYTFKATAGFMSLRIDAKTAAIAGHPEAEGTITPGIPTPIAVINIPDYPHPDGISLIIASLDLENFRAQLALTQQDLREVTKIIERSYRRAVTPEQDRQARERLEAATQCAEPGCTRQRRVFDTSGNGYCKNHARDHGL